MNKNKFLLFQLTLILLFIANNLIAQTISFETDKNEYFAGEVIEFSNISSSEFAKAAFIWNFGDERKSFPLYSLTNKCNTATYGTNNIKHTFNNPGRYKVTLRLDSKVMAYSKYITVLPRTISLRQKTTENNNLVYNGNFETYSAVPTKPGEIHLSTGWYSISGSAADFFHRQFDTSLIYDFSMHIPDNFAGFSETDSNAYAAIITHVGEINYPDSLDYLNYKGYLFHKLQEPLIQGKKYVVQFYCKLSSNSAYSTPIGMYLSNVPVINNSQFDNVVPQLNTPNILHDTLNWHLITDTIEAQGGEQYLYIGNFGNGTPTDIIYPNNFISSIYGNFKAKVSYFYIDNVGIELIFNESAERITLASTGGYYLDNEHSFEYSVGQSIIATLSDNLGSVYLTHGILQPFYFENKNKTTEKATGTLIVNFSPNPATDCININVSGCENDNIYIDIVDMRDKTLEKLDKYYCSQGCSFKVSVKQFQPSVYFLRIHNGKDKSKVIKVVKI